MSKENRNPYQRGNYHEIFAFMKRKQVVTKSQVVEFAKTLKNRSGEALPETAAVATAVVVLSPRKWNGKVEGSKHLHDGGKGDCRGNFSAKGEAYYMEELAKTKGQEQKLRIRYYEKPLPKQTRPVDESKSEKEKTKAVEPVDSTVTA